MRRHRGASERERERVRLSKRSVASFDTLNTWYYSDAPKTVRPTLDAARRVSSFDEIKQGLDEQTAQELQTRARDYLDRLAAEQDARRKELGVEDALGDVPGVSKAMQVALGEAGIKTVEDLADCATDDLVGWTERKASESVRHKGALSDLDVPAAEAESMIMAARRALGWIAAEPEAEPVAEEPAAADAGA